MTDYLRPDYAQGLLFPPTLEDWVPADHPARFVREFVRTLVEDGGREALGLASGPAPVGRPPYDPVMLLTLWLYGYLERIRSSRQLERACYNHLGCIWIAGTLQPDHNTLSLFLRTHRAAIKATFKRLVQVAARLELVGMVVHALDGTKIAAACSRRGMWHRPTLEQSLQELDAIIEALVAETEAADAQAGGATGVPEALTAAEDCRAQVRAALAALEAAGTDRLQPTDPEARLMRAGDDSYLVGYNAQAVVDATSGLVVAAAVVADAVDNHQLTPMLDQVAATLGATAEETLADMGYQSGEAFAQADAAGRAVLVNLERQTEAPDRTYAKESFTWEAAADQYRCPQGHVLTRTKTKERTRGNGTRYRVWEYRTSACRGCPVRDACTRSARGRTLQRTEFDDAYERQRRKQREPLSRQILAYRGSIIERVFGFLKEGWGFRRWTLWGRDGAETQWALLCTAYNLRILYTRWRAGRLALGGLRGRLGALAASRSPGRVPPFRRLRARSQWRRPTPARWHPTVPGF